MRKTLCNVVLAGLLGLGMTAFAQDSTTQQPADSTAMRGPAHHMGDPTEQLAHLTKALNLTSEQQTQIKPLLENQQQQMMQLRQDQSLSRADRMTKAKSMTADTHTKIEAVLNDQQKQKFEEVQQKMEERREQHMQGGAAAPPAQPQQ